MNAALAVLAFLVAAAAPRVSPMSAVAQTLPASSPSPSPSPSPSLSPSPSPSPDPLASPDASPDPSPTPSPSPSPEPTPAAPAVSPLPEASPAATPPEPMPETTPLPIVPDAPPSAPIPTATPLPPSAPVATPPPPEPGETPAPVPVKPVIAVPPEAPPDAPRVFLDCAACDVAYIQGQVGFVRYVRDRADADVHALVSTRATGAGGTEYTVRLIGRDRFAGVNDEFRVVTLPLAPADAVREQLARALRIGLARYALRTGGGENLDVTWEPLAEETPATDPWNQWVFRLAGSGWSYGESTKAEDQASGSASAARVTELWKVRLASYLILFRGRYELEGDAVERSFRRDVGTSLFLARALGGGLKEHAAVGGRLSWSASTYTNRSSLVYLAPVAEWSVFPYARSTRRALVLQYTPTIGYAHYYEETIFDETEELVADQSLRLVLDMTEPWGSATTSLSGGHYFHDVSKARLVSSASLALRLVRGLSVSLSGSFSLLRDQIYLPKGGATAEEILLQKRQLETTYTYSASVGLTYTFGSIFTPVVNTRLEPGA